MPGTGLRATRAYTSWDGMIQRCFNPNNKRFKGYGGRGITVCERWRKFHDFYADMGERPSGLSIDRINNDGDYEPGNCRWATPKQQQNNLRTNAFIEFRGERLRKHEWARRMGISIGALFFRLQHGWSIERALTTPGPGREKGFLEFEGERLSKHDWAARLGITVGALHLRLHLGWSVERALTTPRMVRRATHDGETLSMIDWASRLGVSYFSFRYRVDRYGDASAIEHFKAVRAADPDRRERWEAAA